MNRPAFMCVLFVLSGCAYGEMRQVLRAQVATELSCPEIVVDKKQLPFLDDEGGDKVQYKVHGCGTLRTYTCPKEDGFVSYDDTHCEFVDGDSDAPEVAAEIAEGVEDPFANDAEDGAEAEEEPPAEEESSDDAADDAAGEDDESGE